MDRSVAARRRGLASGPRYSQRMALTPAQEAGFALAALLADDRALTEVASAIDADSMPQLRARLEVAPDEAKAQQLAALLELVRPPLRSLEGLSPRMIALLAAKLPRALVRAAAPHASAARPSFSPTPELVAILVRSARALAAAGPR